MAAHQPKATQIKARKRVAASNAKSGKLKAPHKSASPPKKKPSLASKSLAKKKPAAKKTNAAVKTKPLAKTQAKPAPKPELKSRAGKVLAPDKGGMPSKLTPKGNAAKQSAPAMKPAQSAKQIAKQQAVKLSAKQEQDLRKGEQKPENVEARRTRLKNLLKLGKERGFLTYSEINDHLPDDLVDAEQIESIITTFSDMGIQVYDVAPDAETLLISENAPAVVPDEDAEEEAEAALSTVDPEFGRTTDPVRMYMREMGTVELLTREGEIQIAKRIEDGEIQVLLALAQYPQTIGELLRVYERVEANEVRMGEVVRGINDPN